MEGDGFRPKSREFDEYIFKHFHSSKCNIIYWFSSVGLTGLKSDTFNSSAINCTQVR